MDLKNKNHQRTVRSFVKREGRITSSQLKAIVELFPIYGLSISSCPFNFEKIFNRQADVVLEIGFGMGDTLIKMAQDQPEKDFLGVEVYRPGIGHILKLIHEQSITNLRIINQDAVDVLTQCISNHSLSKIQIFFPDPWPKKRHHKRRLIQEDFLNLLYQKLYKKGIFYFVTDWADYAEHVLKVVEQNKNFYYLPDLKLENEEINWRPKTKFEMRGIKRGHQIFDLLFMTT